MEITSEFLDDLNEFVESHGKKNILMYDIEVYKHDSFVVFLDIHKNKVAYFSNKEGYNGLLKLIKDNLIVGYNNYFYDDFVLTEMLNHVDGTTDNTHIKAVNDKLIQGKEHGIKINSYIRSLDCFQQIDLSHPSLKKIEANKGIDIEETPVDFNIERDLTSEELERAIYYCTYDVMNTVDVFIERFGNYFKPKQYILGLIESDSKYIKEKAYRWNTTTIASSVVKNDFNKNPKSHYIRVPKELLAQAPEDVVDMWKNSDKGTITKTEFNNKIIFGFGGLHSTHETGTIFENVKGADFASLYPNIILNFNLLGDYTPKYREIVDKRLKAKSKMKQLKALENPTDEQRKEIKRLDDEQGALKLIINSLYGLLKSEYSALYDPKIATTVCVIGQIYIYTLAQRLSSIAKIVQTNTDGVYFVPEKGYESWKKICEDFADEVNIKLDYDDFEKVIQKDVNNYIAIQPDGKVKVKGGDTTHYKSPNLYRTVTARICQVALVDYFVKDKPLLDTILEHRDNPEMYQYILQAGATYKGTYDLEGNEYQKVNRVFATTKKDYKTLRKVRQDGGKVSYPNAPEKMFIWNKDVKDIPDFKSIVDVGHYLKIAEGMLSLWLKDFQ